MRMILFFCIFAMPLQAADWPEFRGSTGQGHYTGPALPLEWSSDQNVRWKQPIPGLGWSTPAIVSGKIYLTTAVPDKDKNQSLRVFCLEADTGKISWDKEVFLQDGASAPKIHGKNSHASPSPIVQDGKIYVHFGHQGTACLDLTGKILWKHKEVYAPVHGNGGSPIVVDNALIFHVDGAKEPRLVALDAKEGTPLWSTPRTVKYSRTFAFSTPLLIEEKGQRQVVSPSAGGVTGYDPKNGKELWKVAYNGYSVVPRPVHGHGLVYLSTGYDSPQLWAIKTGGVGDVTESHVAWKLEKNAPHNPSPLLVGTELYLVSDKGIASCLDAKTGKIHWQERINGEYSASPILGGDRIYFLSEQGLCTVVAADKTFGKLAENDLAEKALASLAAVDGAIYLRTAKHLYRIQSK